MEKRDDKKNITKFVSGTAVGCSGFFISMIHLYNPSTDMALASGQCHYTPPRNVAAFEQRNMLLPALYASSGDAVLLLYDNDKIDSSYNQFLREHLRHVRPEDLKYLQEPLMLWGWNMSLRNMLLRYGYSDSFIPSEEEIECWRNLAHRRISMEVNQFIGVNQEEMPHEFFDQEEAMNYVREKGDVMLKMPWSSSGRGVLAVHESDFEKAKRRIGDSIASQGSVMIESFHSKKCDFATEWSSDGKELQFDGYSMFLTDECGRYKGNVVASQKFILREISAFTSESELLRLPHLLKSALEELLLKRAKHPYKGPFGVDGLIKEDGGIVACLEINLRRTMGHVALDIFARHPVEGSKILSTE